MNVNKQNWTIKTLSDVCDLQNGYAFKSKSYVESSNTLNIRMSNIRPDGTFNPEHNIRFLPDSFADEFQQFLLAKGDLVIAMTDMAGDPKILGLPTMVKNLKGRKFLLNQRVGKLKDFSSEIHIPFLTHYLSSPIIKSYYKSKGAGGLQLNISKKDILTAQIPIPPLAEQQQIVALLDQAFAAIDQAKANLEKNIQNAQELFQSKLNAIFSQPALSGVEGSGEGWVERRLGDVCKLDKTKKIKNNLPYVGLEHIESNTGLFLGTLEPTEVKSSTFQFDNTHLLYGRLRPYLNKVLLPNFEGHCSTEIFPIKVGEQISREFLYYWFINEKVVNKINETSTGARMPRANMNEIIKFIIPIPTLVEQEKIVKQLSLLSENLAQFKQVNQTKLNNLEELKKSILQKAFNGELT